METFGHRVQEWQVFYATMAGVSATLVGLLFVALYMNVDMFIKSENQYLKRLARMVYGSFVLVLFSSLMFLIPNQSAWGLATPLFFFGITAVLDSAYAYIEVRPHQHRIPTTDRRRIYRSMWRAFFGRSALVVASVLLFTDIPGLFYWMTVPLLASLLAACQNCWDLLVGARERLSH